LPTPTPTGPGAPTQGAPRPDIVSSLVTLLFPGH
jgi:hypothetical protein